MNIRRETFLAVIIAVVALFFANLPFVYGYTVPKDGMTFIGRKVINTYDTYTYVAFIEQSRQGKFLLENLYSTEAQEPRLIRPLFMFLGKLALVLNITSEQAYAGSRIFLGFVFCFVLYRFLRHFFTKPSERLFAFAVVLASTGVGYFVRFAFPSSTDLWIPESNTFLSLGEAPHFILSQILMLLAFTFFVKALTGKKILYSLLCSASLLLLSLEHPFNIFITFTTMLVLSIVLFYKKKIDASSVPWILLVLAVQVVGIGYQMYETMQNSILKLWEQNNSLPSPSPINFITGYGLLWPFALIGTERFLRRENAWKLLVVVWVVVIFILLYSPLSFQRRVSEGAHIPIAILAVCGIFFVVDYFSGLVVEKARKGVRVVLLTCIFLMLIVGSLYVSFSETSAIAQDSPESYAYYLRAPELQAMKVLKDHTSDKDAVLANVFYGNIIPGVTGRKVFFGHAVQTPFFDAKVNVTDKFLLSKDDKAAYKFLKDNHISFIFLGIADSMVRYGFNPAARPYLEKAYDFQGVQIYHVKNNY